jgi:beta-galactosidase GanA
MRPLLAAVALGAALLLWGSSPAPAAPVSFDRYSLRIEGRRVVLNSGEVHPWRMPDRREWPAVLARLRAAGLNAISIYVPWSYHEPARGRPRWKGRNDVERFLAMARDAGL